MKLRVSTSPIYNLILLVSIMDCGIFTMLSIPILKEYGYRTVIIVLISGILFINCIANKKVNDSLKPYQAFINVYIILLAIFIGVVTIYSYNKYGQGPVELFNCFRGFLPLLFISPLIYVFISQNGYDKILKAVITIVLVVIAVKFLVAVIYNISGTNILPGVNINLRYGRARIPAPTLFGVAFVYVTYKIFEEKLQKNKLKWLAVLIVIYVYEFYVHMTRMYIIAVIVTTIVMILLRPRPKTNQVFVWAGFIAVVAILYFSGLFTDLSTLFADDNEETGASTIARQYAIEYFQQYPKANPLFAMGFVCPTTTYYTRIFSGPTGNCHFDDLGIINMWYHYGILGVILALVLVIRLFYLFIKIYYFTNSKNKLLIAGILSFFIVTQISLSVFDYQRVFFLVFIWAIFEYEAFTSYNPEKRKVIKFTNRRKKAVIEKHG